MSVSRIEAIYNLRQLATINSDAQELLDMVILYFPIMLENVYMATKQNVSQYNSMVRNSNLQVEDAKRILITE